MNEQKCSETALHESRLFLNKASIDQDIVGDKVSAQQHCSFNAILHTWTRSDKRRHENRIHAGFALCSFFGCVPFAV